MHEFDKEMFAEFSCVEMEKSKCTIFQLLDLYFAWLNGYFFVKHATVYFAHVNFNKATEFATVASNQCANDK